MEFRQSRSRKAGCANRPWEQRDEGFDSQIESSILSECHKRKEGLV